MKTLIERLKEQTCLIGACILSERTLSESIKIGFKEGVEKTNDGLYKLLQKPLEKGVFKYRLMIKTHLESGLNYLCVTTKKQYISYKGSGSIWKSIIKSIPSKVLTRVLYRSDNLEDFNRVCLKTSELYDVVNSREFVNLIPEFGYTGNNLASYSIKFSKENPLIMKERGIFAGHNSVKNKLGIYNPELQYMRSDWAKIGADALKEKGTRSGIYSKAWREDNKELVSKTCSRGGKIGGKTTGSMFWWNNGLINCKSFDCPGEEWSRGQIMSEKKRIAFEKMKDDQRKLREGK